MLPIKSAAERKRQGDEHALPNPRSEKLPELTGNMRKGGERKEERMEERKSGAKVVHHHYHHYHDGKKK